MNNSPPKDPAHREIFDFLIFLARLALPFHFTVIIAFHRGYADEWLDSDPERIGLRKALATCIRWYNLHKKACIKEWLEILEEKDQSR